MKKIFCIFLALLITAIFCACGGDAPENVFFSKQDLSGKRIGALSGTAACSQVLQEEMVQVFEFDNEKEMRNALRTGVLDCAVLDGNYAEAFARKSGKLKVLETPLEDASYSIITARENADLQEDINSALAILSEEDTLQKIAKHYIEGTDYVFTPTKKDYELVGTITLAVESEFIPYAYHDEEGNLVGLDVDVAQEICDKIGLKLEIREVSREEMLSLVQKGEVTMAMGRLAKSEEEAKLVNFSESYYTSVQSIVVRKK